MKNTMKKILALVLTMLMLLSVAAPVFANNAVACPEVHSKKNLDAAGIGYTKLTEHKAEKCGEESYWLYRCNACGEYFADDIVLADEKECKYTIEVKPATCNEEGVKKCEVCGHETATPKLTHNYVADYTYDCGKPGTVVTKTCTLCGDKITTTVDGEHTWEITVTLEPQCNVPGNAHYKCTVCGYEKDVVIYADAAHTAHTWVKAEAQEGGCFKDGTTKDAITAGYYCEKCGIAAEIGMVIVVDGKEVTVDSKYEVVEFHHDIDYSTPTTETYPDCVNYGFKFYACKYCGYVDVDAIEVIPTLGHVWEREGYDVTTAGILIASNPCGAGVVGKDVYSVQCYCGAHDTITINHTVETGKVLEPTCTNGGYTYDECTVCGIHNKRDYTAANPADHDYFVNEDDAVAAGRPDDYGIDVKPTCTTEGVAYTKCRNCGIAKYEVPVAALGHDYTSVNDCLNGQVVSTCGRCGDVQKEAIPGFDFNDIKFHKDYDAATDTWNGTWDYLDKATCTTPGLALYICSCHPEKPIIVSLGYGHTIDQTTYIPATEPTCDQEGHGGFEECTVCDYVKGDKNDVIPALGHDWNEETALKALDPTCTTPGHGAWKECKRCGAEEGSKAEIPALGHTITLITDVNANAFNGTNYAIACTKYAYMHYGCTVCDDPSTERWEAYVAATGHKVEITTDPTCTANGEKTCVNPWCDDANKCAEVVPMLKHVDKDGNVIECVAEDFYCYRCQADAEGNIPDGTVKLSWKESHYNKSETIVAGVCTEYHYVLYVCTKCEVHYMEGNIAYAEHDRVNAYWEITTEATFDAPGVESLICGRNGCNAALDTREFTRNDIELSFTFDNALVPGAHIVNSGYLAIKVNLAAYKQMLHSVNFSFEVRSDLVTLVDVVVPENSVFYNMVFASHDVANKDVINVYATVQNAVDSTNVRDVEFTGSVNEFATLIFKVADDANTEATFNKAEAKFSGIDSVVNKVNDSVVNSYLTGIDKTITIDILGDVNNDGVRNVNKVATAIDVNAIRAEIAANGYVAEADVDKDGEITVFDFEYLAKYLVGELTYAELCALS